MSYELDSQAAPVNDIELYPQDYKFLNSHTSIESIDYLPDSFQKIKEVVRLTHSCVGMLAEKDINDRYTLLATAIVIAPNVILTARHSVNEFYESDLCFINDSNKYNDLIIIECGDSYYQDYILFYVVDHRYELHNFLVPTTEPPAFNTYLFSIGFEEENEKLITISQVNSAPLETNSLSLLSNLNTTAGFSGAPYIDANGNFFGFHVKSTLDSSISSGEREGILFSELSKSINPFGILYSILNRIHFVNNGEFTLKRLLYLSLQSYANGMPYDSMFFFTMFKNFYRVRFGENIGILKLLNYYESDKEYFEFADDFFEYCKENPLFFRDFTTSLDILGQEDESKRTYLFGATPRLNSITGNQVLLRYYLKNKAIFLGDQNEWNELDIYIIKSKLHEVYLKLRSGSDITQHPQKLKLKLKRMRVILSNLNNWKVEITTKIRNGKAIKQFIPLNQKRQSGTRQVAAIDMGHKMGVVDFWMHGASGWLKNEKIPEIIKKTKKYPTNKEIKSKKEELVDRYQNYNLPSIKSYDKKNSAAKRKQFMKEQWNYHFQFWSINQKDGRAKGQDVNYNAPKNLTWKPSGSSYKLV